MNTDVPRTARAAGARTRLLIWLFALFVIAVSWAAPLQRLQEDRSEIVAAAVRENQNRATLLEQYVARTLEAADIATLHMAERYRSGDPALRGTPDRPATIRFRFGKCRLCGAVPSGVSLTTTPRSAMRATSAAFSGG